ncbi:MAG: tetratricopeptide repeat protein [Thermodesulfobacteriota bacterium]
MMIRFFHPRKYCSSLIVALLFLVFPFAAGFAQDGRVQGVVLDESGKPLANVKVSLMDSSRGLTFSTETDKNGKYFKRGIIPSTYEITFELDGYVTAKETINMHADWTELINVKLRKIKLDKTNDFEVGTKYFRENNYEEAIEYFRKITKVSPHFIMAHYNLGLSYLRNGNIEQAMTSLNRALELKPDLDSAYFALGECYIQKEMLMEALDCFQKAIAIQPKNPKVYFNIGVILSKNNNVEEALSAFEQSEKLDPHFPSVHYQLGLLFLKKGEYEKAISHFEKFLEVEPNAKEASQIRKTIDELRIRK